MLQLLASPIDLLQMLLSASTNHLQKATLLQQNGNKKAPFKTRHLNPKLQLRKTTAAPRSLFFYACKKFIKLAPCYPSYPDKETSQGGQGKK